MKKRVKTKAALTKNKWIPAKIRVTSSGKVQAKVSASALTKKSKAKPRKRRRS